MAHSQNNPLRRQNNEQCQWLAHVTSAQPVCVDPLLHDALLKYSPLNQPLTAAATLAEWGRTYCDVG